MIDTQNIPKPDKNEIAIISTVGARLRIARELCSHQQNQAAELLGVPVEDLRVVETSVDVDHIPLKLIRAAAEVYNVSTDWLLGLSDDWETDDIEIRKQRDFLAALERLHVENYSKTIAKQIQQDNKIQALSDAVAALAPAIKAIDDSFMQFWKKNQKFADMPGGSTVLRRIDEANAAAHAATCQMVRFKCAPFEALQIFDPETERPCHKVWVKPSNKPLPPPPANPRARPANRQSNFNYPNFKSLKQ